MLSPRIEKGLKQERYQKQRGQDAPRRICRRNNQERTFAFHFLKRLPGLDQSNRRSWASLADKSLQVFKNE
jgi:hypothetical protein